MSACIAVAKKSNGFIVEMRKKPAILEIKTACICCYGKDEPEAQDLATAIHAADEKKGCRSRKSKVRKVRKEAAVELLYKAQQLRSGNVCESCSEVWQVRCARGDSTSGSRCLLCLRCLDDLRGSFRAFLPVCLTCLLELLAGVSRILTDRGTNE